MRQQIICTGHYVKDNEVLRTISKSEAQSLADRCKLAVYEVISGKRCAFQSPS